MVYTLKTSNGSKTITLSKILDWQVKKRTPIPKKTVTGKLTPTTEAEHYTDYPREIVLQVRLTDAERVTLYNMDDDGTIMAIYNSGVLVYAVWLEDIEIKYEVVEHFGYPWKTTLYFVETQLPLSGVSPPAWAYLGVLGEIWMVDWGAYITHYGDIGFFVDDPLDSNAICGGCYFDR